MMYFR